MEDRNTGQSRRFALEFLARHTPSRATTLSGLAADWDDCDLGAESEHLVGQLAAREALDLDNRAAQIRLHSGRRTNHHLQFQNLVDLAFLDVDHGVEHL